MLLAAAAIVVATAAIAAVIAIAGGGGEGPPEALARLAPPDALLWVDAATGRGDRAAARTWAIAERFAAARAAVPALGRALGLRGLDPVHDVRPWLGGEVALALVPAGARTAPLVLAAVGDRAAARAALERLGARPAGGAPGATLLALPRPGALAALTATRLVAGPQAAVRAALARAAGRAPGLDGVPAFARAAGEAEPGTLAVYAPAAGVRRLLAARDAVIRAGAALLDSPRLLAVAAELGPQGGGLRVHGHVMRSAGPAPASFAPTLLGRVPDRSAAMVAAPSGDALLTLADDLGAGAAIAGVRGALAALLAPLRESILSLEARQDVPIATLAAHSAAPGVTRAGLARVQAPLAGRLTGGAQSAFEPFAAGAFTLPVTPELQPSYALSGDVVVASTAQPGLDERRLAPRGIARAPALAPLLAGEDGSVQALGFLDLRQLLGLGERTGLAAGTGFAAVRDDLGPVRSAGVVLRQDPDHPTDTTAELILEIP